MQTARPMAMPPATPMPERICMRWVVIGSAPLVEAVGDQARDGREGALLVLPFGAEGQAAPLGRGHEQDPQNALGVHLFAVHDQGDLAAEAAGGMDELGGRPGMEPEPVDDLDLALDHPRPPGSLGSRVCSVSWRCGAMSLAMQMLRWALACSQRAASATPVSSTPWQASRRTIGRFTPVSTSTFPGSRKVRATLQGVLPNMSVRMRTPCPWFNRSTAART